mmetsp:Transcript_88067/g.247565  ORF Transcript_88067/g.247565 Transcript_88067/m.247565 type:complete len:287 (-) Transcript_88067:880-1740(-)
MCKDTAASAPATPNLVPEARHAVSHSPARSRAALSCTLELVVGSRLRLAANSPEPQTHTAAACPTAAAAAVAPASGRPARSAAALAAPEPAAAVVAAASSETAPAATNMAAAPADMAGSRRAAVWRTLAAPSQRNPIGSRCKPAARRAAGWERSSGGWPHTLVEEDSLARSPPGPTWRSLEAQGHEIVQRHPSLARRAAAIAAPRVAQATASIRHGVKVQPDVLHTAEVQSARCTSSNPGLRRARCCRGRAAGRPGLGWLAASSTSAGPGAQGAVNAEGGLRLCCP